jgi:ABC-type multidrug transport system ATPase subunit
LIRPASARIRYQANNSNDLRSRALAQEARLIVADEPKASLDPTSAAAVMNLLNDIVRNDGVIVISSPHQVAYASSYADRIIGPSHGSSLMDKPATAFVDGDSGVLYAPQSSQQIAAATIALIAAVHQSGSARQELGLRRNAKLLDAGAPDPWRLPGVPTRSGGMRIVVPWTPSCEKNAKG